MPPKNSSAAVIPLSQSFSRIGRHFYYDPAEIEAVIERRKGLGRQQQLHYHDLQKEL